MTALVHMGMCVEYFTMFVRMAVIVASVPSKQQATGQSYNYQADRHLRALKYSSRQLLREE
jgi:hypothetical protein